MKNNLLIKIFLSIIFSFLVLLPVGIYQYAENVEGGKLYSNPSVGFCALGIIILINFILPIFSYFIYRKKIRLWKFIVYLFLINIPFIILSIFPFIYSLSSTKGIRGYSANIMVFAYIFLAELTVVYFVHLGMYAYLLYKGYYRADEEVDTTSINV